MNSWSLLLLNFNKYYSEFILLYKIMFFNLIKLIYVDSIQFIKDEFRKWNETNESAKVFFI